MRIVRVPPCRARLHALRPEISRWSHCPCANLIRNPFDATAIFCVTLWSRHITLNHCNLAGWLCSPRPMVQLGNDPLRCMCRTTKCRKSASLREMSGMITPCAVASQSGIRGTVALLSATAATYSPCPVLSSPALPSFRDFVRFDRGCVRAEPASDIVQDGGDLRVGIGCAER